MNKQEVINQISEGLSRTCPFLITEYHLPEKEWIPDNFSLNLKIGYTAVIHNMVQPYSLYDMLKQNADRADRNIIVKMEVLGQEQAYWDILEGAMGSGVTGKLSQVRYAHYPSFTYRGKLIVCTRLSEEQIRRRKDLAFLTRYCQLI